MVNDLETCEFLAPACDDIAGAIFMCQVYEQQYIHVTPDEQSDIAQKMVERIPPLYAIILEFSYEAMRYLTRGKFCKSCISKIQPRSRSIIL